MFDKACVSLGPTYLAGEFSEGGGDGVGSLGKGRHFKHTHRTIPDHGLGGEREGKGRERRGEGKVEGREEQGRERL